jgi:hypothetical protein
MNPPESICTCGARMPPNARFCHMCGRPLREELQPAVEDREDVRETLPKVALAGPISFGNPDALRSAYISALLASLLTNVPVLYYLCFVWYPAAGFLSVHNYRKRIGEAPSVRGGAKLGWITGVLTFAISLLLGAISSLLPSQGASFNDLFRQQIEQTQMPGQEDLKRQLLEMLQNPMALAAIVLFGLVVSFVMTTGLAVLGGALGARVLKKD